MRIRKARREPVTSSPPRRSNEPPWAQHLDPQERPNREDLAADHNVFTDTLLSPVPLPKWLRGRRRHRDKLS